jgi:L-rhamnonate dehydratase
MVETMRRELAVDSPVRELHIGVVPTPTMTTATAGGLRPTVTPVDMLAGASDLLGGSGMPGLRPASTWAVVVALVDEEGRRGVGSAGVGHPAVVPVLEELRPIVTGRSPRDRELLWETLYRSTLNIGRRGVVMHAISAIDIALWDLLGHQLGLPVYELLGGRVRAAVPAYASRLYATEDLDALAAEAAGYAAQGFTAVKQRFGWGPQDGLGGIRRNVELVRTVVDAVGPSVEVMADAYMGWDAGYAIRCIRAIEDAGLRLRWIEEPVIPDDLRAMAHVREHVDTPIASGEHEATRYGFRDMLLAETVDVLQPDAIRLGGITEARRVWALGEAFGVEVVAHVGAAANLHLSISSHATSFVEYIPSPADGGDPDEDNLFRSLFPGEPLARDGELAPTDAPGLGVSVEEALVVWLGQPD